VPAPVPTPKIPTVIEEDLDPFLDDRPVGSTSGEVGAVVNAKEGSGSEDEDEGPADGSQFFPGSGFF
jgi:hypothetical protein